MVKYIYSLGNLRNLQEKKRKKSANLESSRTDEDTKFPLNIES